MRAVVFVAFAAFLAAAAPTINPNTLTVSGISAGGAMTVQYQVAYSSKVHAAGVIAGIPYGCAGSSGVTGAFECMDDPSSINILSLDQAMNASAAAGEIDPVSNLPNQAAMLFSGTMDTVVNHDTMIALATQYGAVGISDVVTYFNYTAEHAWITNDWGNSCSTLSSPYINNCGLDFAGEFLEMAFKHMNLDFNSNRGTFANSHLKKFNQTVFGADGFFNSLDVKGYYYVPAACEKSSTATTTCHVHLNFHGCEQSHSVIGTEYVVNTGLNQWAETNNIIVVYPQAVGNDLLGNPNACFDWWGYAGSNYATKAGAQLQAFDKIITYLFEHGELPSA